MATQFEFGEAVFRIEGDEGPLQASMQRSRRVVDQAAPQIASKITTVKTQTLSMGQAFALAGPSVSAFAGRLSPTLGPIVGVGSAIASIGASLLTLPGLLIAAGIAVGALALKFYDMSDAVEEANKRLDAQRAKLKAQEAEIRKQVESIDRATALATGTKASELESRTAVREALERQEAALAAEKRKQEEIAALAAIEARVDVLIKELSILHGFKTEADFITNALERRLFLERESLRAAQARTEAEKRLAEAMRSRAAAGEVRTAQEALTFIRAEIANVEAMAARQDLLERAATRIFQNEKLTKATIDVFSRLGLAGFGTPNAAARTPTSTLGDPRAFATLRAPTIAGASNATPDKQLDTARKQLEESRKHTQALQHLVSNSRGIRP